MRAHEPVPFSVHVRPSILLAALAACSAAPSSEGPSASTREAMSCGAIDRGADDIDQLIRNAVVGIDGFNCSGTLISPRIVLTANHCITGSTTKGGFRMHTPAIEVGLNKVEAIGALPNFRALDCFPKVERPIDPNGGDEGTDLAVCVLPETPTLVERAVVTRPALASLPAYSVGFAGWSADSDNPNFRNVGMVSHIESDPIACTWTVAGSCPAAREGDSGGPLFRVNADRSRDVIGVVSTVGDDGRDTMFADITVKPNTDWVRSMARSERWPELGGAHTDGWYARHGRSRSDYWLGEVDYTGPTDWANDQDGDHWYDANDNCPSTWNIDQSESGDEGVGDACAPRFTNDGACTVASLEPWDYAPAWRWRGTWADKVVTTQATIVARVGELGAAFYPSTDEAVHFIGRTTHVDAGANGVQPLHDAFANYTHDKYPTLSLRVPPGSSGAQIPSLPSAASPRSPGAFLPSPYHDALHLSSNVVLMLYRATCKEDGRTLPRMRYARGATTDVMLVPAQDPPR